MSGGYPTVSQVFACLTSDGGIVCSDSRLTTPGVCVQDTAKKVFILDNHKPVAFGVSGDWASIDGVAYWISQHQNEHKLTTCEDIANFIGHAYKIEFEHWHPKSEWQKYKVEGLFVCNIKKVCRIGFMGYDNDFRPAWQGLRALTVGSYRGLTKSIIDLFDSQSVLPNVEEACHFATQFIEFAKTQDESIGGPLQLAIVTKQGVTKPPASDIARWSKRKCKLFERIRP